MPGRYRGGVTCWLNVSTPRFIHGPSKASWMAAAMLDFPERGAPFSTTTHPGVPACVTVQVWRLRIAQTRWPVRRAR
jgi:hypothetical protein